MTMMRSDAPQAAALTRARVAVFATSIGLSLLAAIPLLDELWALSRSNDSASHVVMIPLVSLALVWMDRASVFAVVRTSWAGAAVVAAGALLASASAAGVLPVHAAPLSWPVAGLVLAWVGTFLLVFGRSASRAALFPLLFLVFTIPIPDAVLAAAVLVLKTGSAEAVGVLFDLTATPHYRTGFVFELPSVAIEIADECSGVRSSIALTLTSLLAGHMFLDAPWKRAVLVLAVLPITIFKNAIRIVSLSLLAVHVDPSFLVGQLHHDGGVVFFLLALGLLTPIIALLRRTGTAPRRLPRVFHSFSR